MYFITKSIFNQNGNFIRVFFTFYFNDRRLKPIFQIQGYPALYVGNIKKSYLFIKHNDIIYLLLFLFSIQKIEVRKDERKRYLTMTLIQNDNEAEGLVFLSSLISLMFYSVYRFCIALFLSLFFISVFLPFCFFLSLTEYLAAKTPCFLET